jgi:hypothetical protein
MASFRERTGQTRDDSFHYTKDLLQVGLCLWSLPTEVRSSCEVLLFVLVNSTGIAEAKLIDRQIVPFASPFGILLSLTQILRHLHEDRLR